MSGIDFDNLASPEKTQALEWFEFYSETFLPTLRSVCDAARVHIDLAEREGGARVQLCRDFHQAMVQQHDQVLLAMTDLGAALYPDQKPGTVI